MNGSKTGVLTAARRSGFFHLVRRSRWRANRLLILCYHGLSLRDEHRWNHWNYIAPSTFRRRMQMLANGGYRVLPLAEALERLESDSLPPRSVVLTFDDGYHDFRRLALPILQEFGFPATLYLTTYYADRQVPIFNLILSYLLWKHQGGKWESLASCPSIVFDLRTAEATAKATQDLLAYASAAHLGADAKDELAHELATRLGEDYSAIKRSRLLQIMNPDEVREVSDAGISVELHTHRHRTPSSRDLFLREIRDNRQRIWEITGREPKHFCYPSGVYADKFLPWLEEMGVRTATTCQAGITHSTTPRLLLPRLLDRELFSDAEFESWTSGFSPLLHNAARTEAKAA